MSIAAAYLRMLHEAKKKDEEKLDPVGREDGDIDNDGDKDASDAYLAKRRNAIKKSMKNEEKVECPECEGEGCDHCDDTGYHVESIVIDPDSGKAKKAKKDPKNAKGDDSKPDADVQEATYQVDIAGEGRATVSARTEKEAIAKAYSKMGLRSVRTRLKGMAPKATAKLVKEDTMVEKTDQEKLEPRAKGEKEFADKHTVNVVDRPDATKQDGAEKVKAAAARPGDNKQGDKLKTFKEIRK
jgi:hypothetical protein